MIQLTNHEEAFLVSCLKAEPLVFVNNYKLICPAYQKNDLVPMKPIQRLNSLAEKDGYLALSHGDHSLEFGRVAEGEEGGFLLSRFCQKTIEKPYQKLLFNSNDGFYGKSDTHIDIYDFKRISQIGSIDSRSVVLDFDACPAEQSLLAYLNDHLNISDIRAPTSNHPLLYKQRNVSNLVRWNPIIPYWLASSTADSLKFFDIRYNSPSPVSSIQHANIHELCWSTTNCDMILAASKDRRTNLWSLRHSDDCRLSMTMNRFDLGSLTAGRTGFYGLDDADSLIKIKIRPEYLASFADDAVDLDDDAFYCTDFEDFKEKLVEMSWEAFKESDCTKLKEILALTAVGKKCDIVFNASSISSIQINANNSEFNELLQANTGKPQLNFEGPEIQKFIDNLRLKIRVFELISSEDFSTLKALLNLVTTVLCADMNFFELQESTKFIAFILKNDRRCALTLLMRICASFPIGTPKIIQIWIWMAVYPTIFDSKSFELIKIRPSLSKSLTDLNDDSFEFKIENHLLNLRQQFYDSFLNSSAQVISSPNQKIIQQIYLNLCGNPKNIGETLQTELNLLELYDSVVDEIKEAVLKEKNSFLIISAHLIKLLLESTLRNASKTTFLTDFFLLAFRLEILTERTLVNNGIHEFLSTVGFTRLKFLLSSTTTGKSSAAINSIVTIGTDCYCSFSEEQMSVLAGYLKSFVENLNNGDFTFIDDNFVVENNIKSREFKNELRNLKNKI